MYKKVLILSLLILFLSQVLAVKGVDNGGGEAPYIPDKSYAKEICTPGSLVNVINNWLADAPPLEIEALSHFKRNNQECALIIFEYK